MAYCPNCEKEVSPTASECRACGAEFVPYGWQPLEELPPRTAKKLKTQFSLAGALFKLGLASVAIPFAAILIAEFLMRVIPGCKCHSESDCSGCGIDAFFQYFYVLGYWGLFFSLLTILPGSWFFAAIAYAISNRKKSTCASNIAGKRQK